MGNSSKTLLEAASPEIPSKVDQTKKSKIAPWAKANFVPCNPPSSGDTDEALEARTEALDSKKNCITDVINLCPKQTFARGRSFEQVLNDSSGSPKVRALNDEV